MHLYEKVLVIQLLELLEQGGTQNQCFGVLLRVKVEGDESGLEALAEEGPLLLDSPRDALLKINFEN